MKRFSVVISLLTLFSSAFCQGVYEVVTLLDNISTDDTFIIYGNITTDKSNHAMGNDLYSDNKSIKQANLYPNQINKERGHIYIHRESHQAEIPAEIKLIPVEGNANTYMLKLCKDDSYLINSSGTDLTKADEETATNNVKAQWKLAYSSKHNAVYMTNINNSYYICCKNKTYNFYANKNVDYALGVLYRKVKNTLVVQILSKDHYTATVLPYDADFTVGNNGLTAFIVSDITDQSVILKEVTQLASGEGVVLFDNEKEEQFYPIFPSSEALSKNQENKLKAPAGTVKGDGKTIYALGNKSNGVGFYLVKEGVVVPEKKPYLKVTGGSLNSKEYMGFTEADDEDVVTGIQNHSDVESPQTVWYNLRGQKVSKPHKGIYVCNGKKIVVE